MRRMSLAVVGLVTLWSGSEAQSRSVAVSIGLDTAVHRTGARRPVISLKGLLADPRWNEALDNSLPLVVSYSLETWRSRDGWIDELLPGTVDWQAVVEKEPLQEEYTVTRIVVGRLGRPLRFAVRDSAIRELDLPQRVEWVPQRPGRFYYALSVRITALSDRDMDQLERFLAGDPTIETPEPGTAVGRGIRRFFLRIAGLPSQVLTARSEQFDVHPE